MAIIYRLSHWFSGNYHLILGIGLILLYSLEYCLGDYSPFKATVGVVIGLIGIGYGLHLKRKQATKSNSADELH